MTSQKQEKGESQRVHLYIKSAWLYIEVLTQKLFTCFNSKRFSFI